MRWLEKEASVRIGVVMFDIYKKQLGQSTVKAFIEAVLLRVISVVGLKYIGQNVRQDGSYAAA